MMQFMLVIFLVTLMFSHQRVGGVLNDHETELIQSVNSFTTRTLSCVIPLADDGVTNYTTDSDYQPRLYSYQEKGCSTLLFSFVNPLTMPAVPKSFSNLALCRGDPGCPSQDQLIVFHIGGDEYSETVWPWLSTNKTAINMAQQVANWFTLYNIDGINIDISSPAGLNLNATTNIIFFVNTLKTILNDNIKNNKHNYSVGIRNNIITVAVFGYPQIPVQNALVNNGFNSKNGSCYGNVDAIGIEVFNNLDSLEYVDDYANATNEWDGFPIKYNVPTSSISVGIQGTAQSSVINQMAQDVVQMNLQGFFVDYMSVFDETRNIPGLYYDPHGGADASSVRNETGGAWYDARMTLMGNVSRVT